MDYGSGASDNEFAHWDRPDSVLSDRAADLSLRRLLRFHRQAGPEFLPSSEESKGWIGIPEVGTNFFP